MKKNLLSIILLTAAVGASGQDLQLNDKEYFERQGVNVLVFSNSFNGGFNDEKNSGIEIVHHGVRTVQGGAVRLNNTPEQWDLVPKMTSRKIDRENNSIEVALRSVLAEDIRYGRQTKPLPALCHKSDHYTS